MKLKHKKKPTAADSQEQQIVDHQPMEMEHEDDELCDFDSALDGAVLSKTIPITGANHYDFLPCLASIKERMKKYLEKTVRRKMQLSGMQLSKCNL